MNTGQMMLVIGAIVMLSFLSLASKSMLIDKTVTMLEAEAQLSAISMAQSLIDEMLTKSYDKATLTTVVYNAANFTSAGSLGPEVGEPTLVPLPDSTRSSASLPYKSIKGYNDLDDYNGYARIVKDPRMGNFYLTVSITYVDESNPSTVSSSRTFFKAMTVTITHPNMMFPLRLSDLSVYRQYF